MWTMSASEGDCCVGYGRAGRCRGTVDRRGMPKSSLDVMCTNSYQKRAYFSTLPPAKVLNLLLIATVRHPELPVYPPNVRNLIPNNTPVLPQPSSSIAPQRFAQPQYQSPYNFASNSPMDAAEAQLLGESRHTVEPPSQSINIDLAGHQYDEDDGYDTDPPAHYPKAGEGLMRTLRPQSEDLNWLVDDNFEVFSHSWKGDGTGQGADGTMDGTMDGQKVV
jgi:hypothetical protein